MSVKKICAVVLCVLAVFASCAFAEEWKPNKTINIVCPFSAGGDTDFNARQYANYLSKILGTNVIVTNVTGGAGSIATQQVHNAAPNGYTVLFHTTTFLFNYYAGTSKFGLQEMALSSIAGKSAGWCLAVRSDSPYKTLEDIVKASLEKVVTLASGSGRVSSSADCIGTQFILAGAKFRNVEFGGASDKVTGLLGGEIDAIIVPLITAAPYMKSGDFRVLCCFENERSKYFPDVPTAIEEGYNVANPNYYLAVFPKDTPEDIVKTFTDACEKVYQMPEYQDALVKSFSQAPFFLRGEEADKALEEFCDMIQEVRASITKK